jgi:hypothetical protein
MHMTHRIPSTTRFICCLIAPLFAAATLLLPGCASAPALPSATSTPTLGAVGSPPRSLGEILIEGEEANGDGFVRVHERELMLSGSMTNDLLAISDAARAEGDAETRYAALHLATVTSAPYQRGTCWDRYALMLSELPNYGAVALVDVIDEDIALSESAGRGLSNASGRAHAARRARAAKEYNLARAEYEAAQGYIDDDEEMIERARVRAHAAGILDRGDSGHEFQIAVANLLSATRGDLWESQANRADDVFDGGREEWLRRIESARRRASNALRLYLQGTTPTAPRLQPN